MQFDQLKRRTFITLLGGAAAAWPLAARAQTYPSRPITLIVPYPAGGGVDAMGRMVAQKLSFALGQQFIIENRPGAGGVIGTRAAAKAAPDGYTLVMMLTGISLPANTGYDLNKDFAPVGLIASTPIVVMTHPSFPAQSLADLIALAKKEPGKVTVGTPPPPTINYFAAELFKSLAPDLIVGSGTPIIAALQRATDTIPIVFNVVNDPVGQGFVATLSNPGGNITGFTFIDFPLIGKWLEMLKEIAPDVRRVTLLFNPDSAPFYPVFLREFGAAPASLGVELSASPVHNEADIEAAITAFARESRGGLIPAPDAFINTRRHLIMGLAERHRLPAIYSFRQFVTEGALMSYGPDAADIVRRSASYVDRILKGERPNALPAQAPTKYELVINLQTAKALGLTVPDSLLARADEVIE